MNRRRALYLISTIAGLWPLSGRSQAPLASTKGKPLVSIVALGDLRSEPLASFVEAMRELGYVDGKTVTLGRPIMSGYRELSRLAADAADNRSDVIVAYGTSATRAAVKATKTIPIVMAVNVDPVETGLVTSLARPQGNVTGFAMQGNVLVQKQLELLKQLAPDVRRVGVLFDPSSAAQPLAAKNAAKAAVQAGFSAQMIEVAGAEGIKRLRASLHDARPDAVFVVRSALMLQFSGPVLSAIAGLKIPAVYAQPEWVRAGGLASYGVEPKSQLRRAAVVVDRILKGAKPADIPIELPAEFTLAINLGTAKALRIPIPQALLLRADEVIN